MLTADPQGQDPQGQDPQGQDPHGPIGQDLKGQVRIYQGAQHRFIWPVHLAGWLELGWSTEPGVTPRATPGVTPAATRTSSKPRRSNKEKNPIEPNPIEANLTNESAVGANPSGVSPIGASSATADEPLPVLVTDLLLEPSVPTND